MGLYIEPQIDKKMWCDGNCKEMIESGRNPIHEFYSILKDDNPTCSVVCLVDNGMFYAGAVAYSQAEFNAFNEPDGRFKTWYLIEDEILKMVCPSWNIYMKED